MDRFHPVGLVLSLLLRPVGEMVAVVERRTGTLLQLEAFQEVGLVVASVGTWADLEVVGLVEAWVRNMADSVVEVQEVVLAQK